MKIKRTFEGLCLTFAVLNAEYPMNLKRICLRVAGAAVLAVAAGCAAPWPGELEAIRAAAEVSRARAPRVPVGAEGTLAQALAFAASGEAEEIDYWKLTEKATDDGRAELRAALDAGGGKAVKILGPDETYAPDPVTARLRVTGFLAGSVLAAGSGRVLLMMPDGRVVWEKRGCGNVHTARRVGKFVYYSNGALWRVPFGADAWANPECVWRPADARGGGVLCFDATTDGTLVLAVNSQCEVVELDARTGVEIARFAVDARDAAGVLPGAHGRLRCVRKTPQGTYLVCCAGAETVREYDRTGREVGKLKAPAFVFDAVRTADGRTVVSHVTGVTEFAPDGRAVWSLTPADVAETGAANFTAVQPRANGNLVVGTWASGAADGSRAGMFEVTRGKKVVWAAASRSDVNLMSAVRDGE